MLAGNSPATDVGTRAGAVEPSLEELVATAAHLLPEQAPLHAFVHHNTLHAFEDYRFEEGVLEASQKLGTEPYSSEEFFAKQVATGRISTGDLRWVVKERLGDGAQRAVPGGVTRGEFRVLRLQNLIEIPRGELREFCIEERGSTRELHACVLGERRKQLIAQGLDAEALEALWSSLRDVAPMRSQPKRGVRRRDQLLERTGLDADDAVNELMIRLCGAFLDQGIAYWSMPNRAEGFLHAVRALYALPIPPPEPLFRRLAGVLRDHQSRGLDAVQTIRWALDELEVPTSEHGPYIEETLLSLRGWAGMMHHFETRPDHAPVKALNASLMDYLAVRLVLDTVAARTLLEAELGPSTRFEELATTVPPSSEPDHDLAYEAFVLAQLLPVEVAGIRASPQGWLDEVHAFGNLERREFLLLAYERHHQVEVLEGLRARVSRRHQTSCRTEFQAAFCIDDREESTRRHLEEACPEVETFGYPGFYGVAMEFQAADAHRGRPLCPASMRADHRIVERATAPKSKGSGAKLRFAYHVGRASLVRGALISALGGVAAAVPWVLTTLFRKRLGASKPKATTPTTIGYRRDASAKDDEGTGLPEGYTVEEMVAIVGQFLRHTGLEAPGRLAKLVVICGHVSTSINNPHLAAYGCGATGGGCGGHNARVFAMMANDPDVRAELARKGLEIPDDTHFVGALHDTCVDEITLYDEEAIPAALAGPLALAKKAFVEAMANNAAERCRLFGTLPLDLSPSQAQQEVEVRSRDLSEARPEYNHAKNSQCIVGPRHLTRDLFLDQRAFLVSYDEQQDPDGSLLAEVLTGSLPVSIGINLEYYFSSVDPIQYGAGSKLPHNITGLFGVMDGAGSDLRTGLYEQMIELHEPVRLLAVILAAPHRVHRALELSPSLDKLVRNRWCYLVCYDTETDTFHWFGGGGIDLDSTSTPHLRLAHGSLEACRSNREPVGPTLIEE